jgi:hypothetical protein
MKKDPRKKRSGGMSKGKKSAIMTKNGAHSPQKRTKKLGFTRLFPLWITAVGTAVFS